MQKICAGNLKEMCDCKVMANECCKAAMYGRMQNGSHGEKEKGRENKAKDKMVKTEEKLPRSV